MGTTNWKQLKQLRDSIIDILMRTDMQVKPTSQLTKSQALLYCVLTYNELFLITIQFHFL